MYSDLPITIAQGNNRNTTPSAPRGLRAQLAALLSVACIPAVTAAGPDRAESREAPPALEQAGKYLIMDLSAGPAAARYPVHFLDAPPEGGWNDTHRTSVLVLRRIPAGTLTVTASGPDRVQRPHEVMLTRDFYIGVFEVTQRQWEQVMGNWPGYFDHPAYRETRPVEQVSYRDIRGGEAGAGWPGTHAVDPDSFLGRLRERTGLDSLDLPTEAQWEYACRAGTTTDLNSGRNVTGGHCPHMDEVGRYIHNGGAEYASADDPSVGTARVGSYRPNAWGLYDMHGNVYELCLDWFTRRRILDTPTDPRGFPDGSLRVRRGGSWLRHARDCRSESRERVDPDERHLFVGFRVAKHIP